MSHYISPSFDFCPHCGAPTHMQHIDNQDLKACTAQCGFVHFNNPTPVVAVIVETPQGVVLAHNTAWPEGMFSIITGFVDAYELPEQTAIRETQEELGLTAADLKYVGNYMFAQKNQLIIAYAVKAEGEIKLNHELDAYKTIEVARLQGWPGATGEAVNDWLTKIKPFE